MFLVPSADFTSLEDGGGLIRQHLQVAVLLLEFLVGFLVIGLYLFVRGNGSLFSLAAAARVS